MKDSVSIPTENAKRLVSDGSGCNRPSLVACECPHCGYFSSFQWNNNHTNVHSGISSGNSECANCSKKVRFLAIFPLSGSRYGGQPTEVRMSPAPKASYELSDMPRSVPDRLQQSMQDAVRAYNAQIYGATATSGRRTLEGIFKYMLPEDQRKQNLYQLIRAAEDRIDFKEPLTRLADAIREGGNLGAHFDEEKEPDAEMARRMLDLLSYLIEYLYVLPTRIQDLEERLSQIDPN